MKQSLLKKISYIVCCTMAAGAVGATAAYAVNENTDNSAAEEKPAVEETASEDADSEPVKDETVYVIANAYGNADNIIVSDWLKNAGNESTITESSTLRNVKNVKGDETYTENGDTRTWNAGGNDICYQGTSTEELPVTVSISYKLDGEDISSDSLAGKSGRVTIRFDYTNTQYITKKIDGEDVKIYVPFAAITGTMLDSDKFRNVEVTNGKLVNDGNNIFVIGTAFPGMTESLGVSDTEKVKIPGYVEITADVKNFSLPGTVTAVTNEVFKDIDLDLGDEETTATEDIDKLSDAMDRIIEGSGALYDGLSQLLEKSGDLTEGVAQLKDGASKLSEGAASAHSGAAQLYDGSVQLSAGLEQLTSNNEQLTAGSKQVFQSLLDMANSQMKASGIDGYTLTIENYADTLTQIIDSLSGDKALELAEDTAREQVTAAVREKQDLIRSEVEKAVKEQVIAKVNEAVTAQVREKVTASVKESVAAKVTEATLEQLTSKTGDKNIAEAMIGSDEVKAKIDAAVEEKMKSEEVQKQIDALTGQQMQTPEVKAMADAAVGEQMASDEIKALIDQKTSEKTDELIEENMASDEVQSKIKEGLSTAEAGAKKLYELKTQLDSYNTFYTGLAQYTDGVAQAAGGADKIRDGLGTLSTGTADLSDGMDQLCAGIEKMDESMPALIDGITKLTDGSEELSDGCVRFNDEGISKIVSLLDGDLGGILERSKALKEAAEEYSTYTGGSGSVKFIYKTAGIDSEQ